MTAAVARRRRRWLLAALLALALAPAVVPVDAARRDPPPLALRIDAIGVDAVVEAGEIVDGQLSEPSGPWVVRWYRETARPGDNDNVVIGGHLDYWSVGPAVFWRLGSLVPGSAVDVIDTAGNTFAYRVDWLRTYPASALTPEQLRTIVGATDAPSLTLITCAGQFDSASGMYPARLVVRARRAAG